MTTRPRFEANDGVVVLINGTAKVDVLENCFTQNGRTQVIEFQSAVGKPVKAKIVPLLYDAGWEWWQFFVVSMIFHIFWAFCVSKRTPLSKSRKKMLENWGFFFFFSEPQLWRAPTFDFWENSNRPLEHTPDPQLPVYEGNPFIFEFWGTWGLFQGSVGTFLDWWNLNFPWRLGPPRMMEMVLQLSATKTPGFWGGF